MLLSICTVNPSPKIAYPILYAFWPQRSKNQTQIRWQSYCQTLTVQRNTDRWITDSRILSTLQFIEANRSELSGKLPTLFTNQQAARLASYPNCFWAIWHISTLLCYFLWNDFEFWSFPVVQDMSKQKQNFGDLCLGREEYNSPCLIRRDGTMKWGEAEAQSSNLMMTVKFCYFR